MANLDNVLAAKFLSTSIKRVVAGADAFPALGCAPDPARGQLVFETPTDEFALTLLSSTAITFGHEVDVVRP